MRRGTDPQLPHDTWTQADQARTAGAHRWTGCGGHTLCASVSLVNHKATLEEKLRIRNHFNFATLHTSKGMESYSTERPHRTNERVWTPECLRLWRFPQCHQHSSTVPHGWSGTTRPAAAPQYLEPLPLSVSGLSCSFCVISGQISGFLAAGVYRSGYLAAYDTTSAEHTPRQTAQPGILPGDKTCGIYAQTILCRVGKWKYVRSTNVWVLTR